MKLIEQAILVFRKGRSEKVYEVDLCEVGEGRYVVNFRYGRRGDALKDGTKTVAPVSEAAAREAYDKLVSSKRQQGYAEGPAHAVAPARETPPPSAPPSPPAGRTPAAAAPPEPSPAPVPEDDDPRRQAVLARLARGDAPAPGAPEPSRPSLSDRLRHLAFRRRREPVSKEWSLSRAIWRAGELRIESAAPLLAGLLGTGDEMRDYCVAWALGRCRNPAGVAALRRLRGRSGTPEKVRRMATAALLELAGGEERTALVEELAGSLPEELAGAALGDSPEALTAALRDHLSPSGGKPYLEQDPRRWEALETLYLMNTATTRAAVVDALAHMPMKPPAFQRWRRVFKLAEMRRDGQVFGLAAYRVATTEAMYHTSRRGGASVPDRSGRRHYMRQQQLRAMLSSERPTAAYGSATRWYLRQRVWRTLRRLGELGDADYVSMAVGTLLPFTDEDGKPTRTETGYRGGGWTSVQLDRYSPYWAFNHVLYSNSPRYERSGRRWTAKGSYRPGEAPPRGRGGAPVREEAFPELWNQRPQAFLHLLSDSRCAPVHDFAVAGLRSLPDFCAGLPASAVAMILAAPYEATIRFGFELAQARYRPGASEDDLRALALAVATCGLADLRREAQRWMRESPALFLGDAGLLAGLVVCPHEDTRRFALELIRGPIHRVPDDVARALVGRLVAHLMTFDEKQESVAADLVATLKEGFAALLAGLGSAVVDDCATHPLAAVQSFAAWLLLEGLAADGPSDKALEALLESEHAEVQALGVRVLGLLDDTTLLEREQLLWSLTTHRDEALRDAVRDTVKRLAESHAEFGGKFLQMLIAALLRRRLAEGVPGHVVRVLRKDFTALLPQVPEDVMWRLLRSKSTAAQELGGVLLPERVDPAAIEVEQMAELGRHDVLSVRQASWRLYEQSVPRLKADMESAVLILDSDWEDSRVFAFDFFETRFDKDDFSPAVLVSICDSVRSDVQRFGRALITRHFDEAAGEEYLLKLSEHPASDVQLFATNFLDRYASGSAERLEELSGYFVRTLCGVNRGRVAKQRIHGFLRGEALADEAAARVVAGVLARQSATASVEDRAEAIETLALIARTWPEVTVPLVRREAELRITGGAP